MDDGVGITTLTREHYLEVNESVVLLKKRRPSRFCCVQREVPRFHLSPGMANQSIAWEPDDNGGELVMERWSDEAELARVEEGEEVEG